ncbi:MAG: GldG family protein [Oscillospiraceae bacterium]|jgi:hypothetical protein|nr:GldG family protein [Oscillospiraceae bacterium]
MNHRKLKYGGLALALALAGVGVFVLINLLGDLLTDRFYLKLDMTRERLYEISEETTQALDALTDPVTVYVWANESDFGSVQYMSDGTVEINLPAVRETLDKYEALSRGKVSVEYRDPTLSKALLDQYNPAGDLSLYDMTVTCGQRYKNVALLDMFAVQGVDDYGYGYATSYQTVGMDAEQQLTTAIMTVTLANPPRAVFLQGHGEYEAAALKSLLEKANYLCEDVNLTAGNTALPDDTALLILNTPEADLSAEEIYHLDDYLSAGGKAFFFLMPTGQPQPVLDRFLADWGISFEQKLIFDAEGYNAQPLQPILAVLDHEATDALQNATLPVVLPYASPVVSLWAGNQQGGRIVTPLLKTAATAYARDVYAEDASTSTDRQPGDEDGPFTAALLTEEYITDSQGEIRRAGLFVSSFYMGADDSLAATPLLNGRFVAALISYMNPEVNSVVIPTKEYDIAAWYLNTDILGVKGVWVAVLTLVPLCFAVFGYLVWRRRRHL